MDRQTKEALIGCVISFFLIAIVIILGTQVLISVRYDPKLVAALCCNGSACSDTYVENMTCVLSQCMNNALITNKSVCTYAVKGIDALQVLS